MQGIAFRRIWRKTGLPFCFEIPRLLPLDAGCVITYTLVHKTRQVGEREVEMESPAVTTPFQQALEIVEQLSAEDQENLIEIVQRRLLEQRRAEIASNARSTLQTFREGRARYGTVEDLRHDLLDVP
jgi:hypothetical protein